MNFFLLFLTNAFVLLCCVFIVGSLSIKGKKFDSRYWLEILNSDICIGSVWLNKYTQYQSNFEIGSSLEIKSHMKSNSHTNMCPKHKIPIEFKRHRQRHSDTDTHRDTERHTHTDTHMHTRTRKHTHTHTHTHTHRHTHTHTHTHTNTQTQM